MRLHGIVCCALALALFAPGAEAQYGYPPQPYAPPPYGAPPPYAPAPALYGPAQLDQMLAPIALYPDPLLTQVLTAATYPGELDQAARWCAANPYITGQQLAFTIQNFDWDPSVKSLTPFPQILQMLDEHLDWTEALGNAFLMQQPDVMDSIQRLRRQAVAAGTLLSSPYQTVIYSGSYIEVEPSNPQLVYVPVYDPRQVYGVWAYPSYQPYYWGPPPGLATPYVAGAIGFGVAIGVVDVLWNWGRWDWQHHDVHVDRDRFNRIDVHHPPVASSTWHHDAARGAPPPRPVPGREPETRPPERRRPGAQPPTGAEQQRTNAPPVAPRPTNAPPERRGPATQPPTGAPQQTNAPPVAPQQTNAPPERRGPAAPVAPPQRAPAPVATQPAPPAATTRPAAPAPAVQHPAPPPAPGAQQPQDQRRDQRQDDTQR